MLHIRVVKTSSGVSAVQIVYYNNRKRVIFKHIGSCKTVEEVDSLIKVAQDIINNYSPSLPLFEETKFDNLLYLDKCEFWGVH